MEKSIKGTRTEQNLLKSFAGESQARSRYTFFASVAKKEGYEQIAGVFMETAEQEKEHAKRFFKFIETGTVFEKAEAILWQCRNCGFVIESKKAPQKCPACEHPQAYFEPMKQNY